jgi:preprotein translocase subunit SecG
MLLNILLGVIIVVCVALVALVLLQRSEGGALGMSGGGPGAFMTARGTGDFLTRTTWILGLSFFALCLAMTLISGHNRASSSVVDRLKLHVNPSALAQPAAPAQPSQSAPPVGGFTAPAGPQTAPSAPPPAQTGPLNPFGPNTVVTPAAKPAPAKKPAQ